MHKEGHVWIKVTEAYRDFRNTQTYLNRFVWSSELCYSYFLDVFQNDSSLLNKYTGDLFCELPIQAWYKNKKGTSKYNLRLHEHNEVLNTNQTDIFKSAIILFSSYFEEYLNRRFQTTNENWGPFALRLDKQQLRLSNFRLEPRKIFKADICRIIRNELVHKPETNFSNIDMFREFVKNRLSRSLNTTNAGSFLYTYNSGTELTNQMNFALNEVIDSAKNEISNAGKRGISLPYEYFFMLYTFTNYDDLALDIEQILFSDSLSKPQYNRVSQKSIRDDLVAMIAGPSIIGLITDFKSKAAVENVEVKVQNNPAFSISDINGKYFLTPNLPEGINRIEFNASNYESLSLEVTVVKDSIITVNIELKPLS